MSNQRFEVGSSAHLKDGRIVHVLVGVSIANRPSFGTKVSNTKRNQVLTATKKIGS